MLQTLLLRQGNILKGSDDFSGDNYSTNPVGYEWNSLFRTVTPFVPRVVRACYESRAKQKKPKEKRTLSSQFGVDRTINSVYIDSGCAQEVILNWFRVVERLMRHKSPFLKRERNKLPAVTLITARPVELYSPRGFIAFLHCRPY